MHYTWQDYMASEIRAQMVAPAQTTKDRELDE
jgi:hypothetical protein